MKKKKLIIYSTVATEKGWDGMHLSYDVPSLTSQKIRINAFKSLK